ncbi:MAG: SH3 domain-containing protein [Paraclostridium sp.]
MKLKRKSILAGLISAAIVIPVATEMSFANGNEDDNIQEANGNNDENIQEVDSTNIEDTQEVNINTDNSVQERTADYRSITGNGVHFRKGPATSYSSITKFSKGTKVEFLGNEGSWTKVRYNSTEGYVHSDYVSGASSGNNDNNSGNTDNTIKSNKVVTGSSVNFRKGPGTGHGIITSLKKGTQVGYISESNGWAKVSYNGTIGYMSANYLGNVNTNPTPDPNPGDSGNTDNTVKSTKQVTGSSVNFRKGPGTGHGVITSLKKGTQVGYISESNGWAKISYNGTIGYISANYLGDVSTAPTPDPNPGDSGNTDDTVKSTKQVTGNSVNFRKGPGTNYGVIRSLSRGTQVGYISESNGWAKINYNGTIGYMSANYIGDVSTNPGDGNGGNPSIPDGSRADAVIEYAKKQLGKPYVWGAEGPDSFDCSGYTQYVFRNSVGVSIPRVSRDQSRFGQSVSRNNLQKGDLIFFDTDKNGSINHVGIYMGNNQFIHASSGSSSRKVVISEINSFYSSSYVNARRVL